MNQLETDQSAPTRIAVGEVETDGNAQVGGKRSKVERAVYGTFLLGGDEYGIEMSDLQEVVNAPDVLQRMPLSPAYLRGLFNLRGQILPVIDLHVLLKTSGRAGESEANRRMVVLRRGAARIGILFDSIGEVLRVGPEELVPVGYQCSAEAGSGEPAATPPVQAVLCRDGKRMIQVLDLKALLLIHNMPAIESNSGQKTGLSLANQVRDVFREKLIGFTVGDCALALEMKCVAGIVENKDRKPSPVQSAICDSIILFHGRIVPVVELRGLLKITTDRAAQRILICRLGKDYVGFEVDEVTSLIPYAKDRIQPVPILDKVRASVFHGAFTDSEGKSFIVLNEEGLLARAELIEISVSHSVVDQKKASVAAVRAAPHMSLLTFRMGKVYGLKLLDVLEVIESPAEFARAPDTPAAVLGILNLRGTPVSVLDPRVLFGLGPAPEAIHPKILIFQHQSSRVAMRVDSVESIVSVPIDEADRLPDIFFREDQANLKDSLERGIHIQGDGTKSIVLIVRAEQIIARLWSAMAA